MEKTPLTYEEKGEEEESRVCGRGVEKRKGSSLCLSEGVFGSSAEAGDGP